jgi:trans-2,3-dihydro-3-hydroxyanthranilate isomerase
LPSNIATSRVRIFTPTFEMPFAGHPMLGSAHVVRALGHGGDSVTLEMKAGVSPVTANGDVWTLQAKAPKWRPAETTQAQIAAMLGIDVGEVGDGVMWVDTGSEQLLIPLGSPEAVSRCQPDPFLLSQDASNDRRNGLAYVWANDGANAIVARFFFLAPPQDLWA